MFIALLILPAPASAELTRLTYVTAIDLEVSYFGKKDQWCAPRLDLVLVTSRPAGFQDNRLLDIHFVELVKKLKNTCPALTKVGIVGYSRGAPDLPLVHGSYLAKNNWQFSNSKLPARQNPTQQATPPDKNASGVAEKSSIRRITPLPQKPAIPFEQYGDANDPDQFDAGFDLALRLAYHEPAILDDDDRLLDWLNFNAADKRSSMQPQAQSLLGAYSVGTDSEKSAILVQYKRLLKAIISTRQSRFSKAVPLYFRLPYRISADYQPNKGFPVEPYRALTKWRRYFQENSTSMQAPTGIEFLDAHAPISWDSPISFVPIFDERKKRILTKLLDDTGRYRFELRLYARIGGFSSSAKSSPLMRARNRVDRVAVEMFDIKTPGAPPKLVHRWDVSNGEEPRMPVLEFAKWADIKTRKGRLLLQEWKRVKSPDAFIPFSGNHKLVATSDGWSRFANLVAIKQHPKLLENKQNALTIARKFLTPREKAALVLNRSEKGKLTLSDFDKDFLATRSYLDHGRNGVAQGLYDDFEYQEFLMRFRRKDFATRAYRYLPEFPIPITAIRPVLLGRFEVTRRLFPLQFRNPETGKWVVPDWKPGMRLPLYRNFDLRRFPSVMRLSLANAEKLVKLIKQLRPNVKRLGLYLAIFAELQSVEDINGETGATSSGQYDIVTQRVALYLDRALKKKVIEIPLSQLTGKN